MFTSFWDMHSGGGSKEKFDKIYIEAPEDEAKIIFYNRFGHNPERVSCTCCGEDYSVSEYKTLEEASQYHRKKRDEKPMSVAEYILQPTVLVIFDKDILPDERVGEVPAEGYHYL